MGASPHDMRDPARLAQEVLVASQATTVVNALADAQVPVIFLKGLSFWGWIYTPGERRVTDIDILIPRQDMPRAEKVMADLGYVRRRLPSRPITDETFYEVAFTPRDRSRQTTVELHTGLAHDVRYRFDLDGLFMRAEPWQGGASDEARRLSTEDCLLHLAVHRTIHSYGFDDDFRNIEDAARIVRVARPDWPTLLRRAREWGCSRALWILLDSARKHARAAVADDVLRQISPSPPLMRYLRLVMTQTDGVWVFRWPGLPAWQRRLLLFPLVLDAPRQHVASALYFLQLRFRDQVEVARRNHSTRSDR